MPTCKLTKKSHSHILFLEYITITSCKEALKMRQYYFQKQAFRGVFLGKAVLKICSKFIATLLKSHFGMGVLL